MLVRNFVFETGQWTWLLCDHWNFDTSIGLCSWFENDDYGPPTTLFFSFLNFFIIEKLRLFAHAVGSPSHKGIARRALPASGGKDGVGEI